MPSKALINLFNFVGGLGLNGKKHSEFIGIYDKIKAELAAVKREMQEALELNNQMKQIVDEVCDERDAAVAEAAALKDTVDFYESPSRDHQKMISRLEAELATNAVAEAAKLREECERLKGELELKEECGYWRKAFEGGAEKIMYMAQRYIQQEHLMEAIKGGANATDDKCKQLEAELAQLRAAAKDSEDHT